MFATGLPQFSGRHRRGGWRQESPPWHPSSPNQAAICPRATVRDWASTSLASFICFEGQIGRDERGHGIITALDDHMGLWYPLRSVHSIYLSLQPSNWTPPKWWMGKQSCSAKPLNATIVFQIPPHHSAFSIGLSSHKPDARVLKGPPRYYTECMSNNAKAE